MPSQIDPTKPIDGVPASKADLRANLQSAKNEIEALQSGKADLGHQHGVADISDAGALASKDTVATADIADDAVTNAKLANMSAATFKGRAAGAGTGDPSDLTATQAKTALAISASDVSGLGTLATLSQVGTAQISDDAVARHPPDSSTRIHCVASASGSAIELLRTSRPQTSSCSSRTGKSNFGRAMVSYPGCLGDLERPATIIPQLPFAATPFRTWDFGDGSMSPTMNHPYNSPSELQ